MKYTKSRKKIIVCVFAGSILFANVFPLYANNLKDKNEFLIEKSDTIKLKSADRIPQENNLKNNKIESTKSTAELSYNIVYYLISKIIQITTISRPR